MMGLISGWVRKPMGSLRGEGTGLLRPNRLDNWSRAMVATVPVLAGDDDVVVLVEESPPSRPKPKRPPSGA